MRWTNKYVWGKVLDVVPTAKIAGMSLPEALNQAAIEFFLGYYREFCWESFVISTCIKELRDKGFLEFGTVNEDWL
jgi:hypothetical protein